MHKFILNFITLYCTLNVLGAGKTSAALSKLISLQPKEAVLVELDKHQNVVKEESIKTELLQKGDVIKIYPGSKVCPLHLDINDVYCLF